MWVMLNNSFLSVVENRNNKNELLVRARIKGDIENIFNDVKTFEDEKADYKYRAFIPRDLVEKVIASQVASINYANFKGSISLDDEMRHRAYMRVWSEMYKVQA